MLSHLLTYHFGGDSGNALINGRIKETKCNLSTPASMLANLDLQQSIISSGLRIKLISALLVSGPFLPHKSSRHLSVFTGILDGIGASSSEPDLKLDF